MKFDTLDEVLSFALDRETKARSLYLAFQKRVKDPAARKLLGELAGQEEEHGRILEKARATHRMSPVGGTCAVADMKLADYMVGRELGPDSEPQDVMMFAMQMEKRSSDFYRELAKHYEGTPLADAFAALADQERCHKEALEKEYEERFLQWM